MLQMIQLSGFSLHCVLLPKYFAWELSFLTLTLRLFTLFLIYRSELTQ